MVLLNVAQMQVEMLMQKLGLAVQRRLRGYPGQHV